MTAREVWILSRLEGEPKPVPYAVLLREAYKALDLSVLSGDIFLARLLNKLVKSGKVEKVRDGYRLPKVLELPKEPTLFHIKAKCADCGETRDVWEEPLGPLLCFECGSVE